MSRRGVEVAPERRAAYEVVRRVFEHDAWADRALPAAVERHGLDPRQRAAAMRLAFGTVQRRASVDWLLTRLSDRAPRDLDPPVAAAIRLGLFELCFSERRADHAVVDGAVELAKGGMRSGTGRRAAGAGGFVNAVLRRATREGPALVSQLGDDDPAAAAIAHSVPLWLAEMWWRELGPEAARSLLAALNEPVETALRANTLKVPAADLRADLERAGEPLAATRPGDSPAAIVWTGRLGESAREALADGRAIAQSRGSQAVGDALAPQVGHLILDLCAGPGVKTTHLAALAGGEARIVSVERDEGRARQIAELADRAGAGEVEVRVADAGDVVDGDAEAYDRVLVDPPCSDLGTLASRPDARWRKDPELIDRVAAEQARILDAGVAALRPGGRLVYSTCTISRAENEEVVARALERHPGLSETSRRVLRPDTDGTDGFFIAALERSG